MQYAKNFLRLWIGLLVFACCLYGRQASAAPISEITPAAQQNWRARVQSTADDTTKAREVIIDSIFANQTLLFALAYEAMYNRKPQSQIRLANFAHAAAIAEVFSQQYADPLEKMYGRAIRALKKIVVPEQELYPTAQAKAALNKTKVADAWLAWGLYLIRYTMDYKSAGEAYKRALELDPTLAEANYWQADMVIAPYNGTYFTAHKSEALKQLDAVERQEPKLRPLTVDCRAGIALGAMDYKQAVPYLREYLRLWPTSPRAAIVTKLIGQLETQKPH